jgi:hypothetical protein
MQGAVWTMTVVMAFELAEYGCGVSLVDYQKTVEELAADRSDEAVGARNSAHVMRPADIHGGGRRGGRVV